MQRNRDALTANQVASVLAAEATSDDDRNQTVCMVNGQQYTMGEILKRAAELLRR